MYLYFRKFAFMRINIAYISILIIGICFLLTPSSCYACGLKSCSTSAHKKATTHHACSQKSGSHNHKDCNGNCKDQTCHCVNVSFNLALHTPVYSINNVFFYSQKKQSLYTGSFLLSTGYFSMWLPPKIS